MVLQAERPPTSRSLKAVFREKTAAYQSPEEEKRITAIDAVQECLARIQWCRKQKYSWDAIAEMICDSVQEAYGAEIKLTGRTLRNYYYELTQ
jgi:hypothetical protein